MLHFYFQFNFFHSFLMFRELLNYVISFMTSSKVWPPKSHAEILMHEHSSNDINGLTFATREVSVLCHKRALFANLIYWEKKSSFLNIFNEISTQKIIIEIIFNTTFPLLRSLIIARILSITLMLTINDNER